MKGRSTRSECTRRCSTPRAGEEEESIAEGGGEDRAHRTAPTNGDNSGSGCCVGRETNRTKLIECTISGGKTWQATSEIEETETQMSADCSQVTKG
jgi:hypothetical protein